MANSRTSGDLTRLAQKITARAYDEYDRSLALGEHGSVVISVTVGTTPASALTSRRWTQYRREGVIEDHTFTPSMMPAAERYVGTVE